MKYELQKLYPVYFKQKETDFRVHTWFEEDGETKVDSFQGGIVPGMQKQEIFRL